VTYSPESEQEAEFLQNYDASKYPITVVTVDTIITRGIGYDREVVLIKRKNFPYRNHWALPGGFMDEGETAEQAAVREVKEEAGLDLKDIKFFNLADVPDRDPRCRAISVVFLAESSGIPFAGDDAVEAGWWKMSDVQLMPLAFDHNMLVAQAWTYALEEL
jgi:8-oxo-dGTP diphosphatase